jgi:GNAT superfamily N-acetyltransferase
VDGNPAPAIRPAAPGDGERLREIARAAKAVWGYDPERVRDWAARLDLSAGRLAGADVLVAEIGGDPVGWAEVLPRAAGVCELDHLWVEPGWMRRGIGSRLFRAAAARSRGLGAHVMEWEAEPNATGFYERMGAVEVRTAVSEWGRELRVMGVDLRG